LSKFFNRSSDLAFPSFVFSCDQTLPQHEIIKTKNTIRCAMELMSSYPEENLPNPKEKNSVNLQHPWSDQAILSQVHQFRDSPPGKICHVKNLLDHSPAGFYTHNSPRRTRHPQPRGMPDKRFFARTRTAQPSTRRRTCWSQCRDLYPGTRFKT
jgi:hypothetical protein